MAIQTHFSRIADLEVAWSVDGANNLDIHAHEQSNSSVHSFFNILKLIL